MSSKERLEKVQQAARKAEKAWAEQEAREQVAEEEFENAKKAVKELGFKRGADLQEAVKKDKAELEEALNELEDLLANFMEAV